MDEKKNNLSSQFANLTWLMHKYHQRNHHKLQGAGIVPHRGQGRVIKLLKIHPKISQKDLSYLLDIRPQSLGELLGKLEKNGYISRTPSETDKRVMIIELTEKGMELPEEDENYFNFTSIFECLNTKEQNTLSEYLDRITVSLEEEIKNEEPDLDIRNQIFERFIAGAHMRGKFGSPPFKKRELKLPHNKKKSNKNK